MVNIGPGHALPVLPIIIGDSPGMLDAVAAATRVADTTAGVLIQGEPGTGKELLARYLHGRGRRRKGPFVAVNCAERAGYSLERELFGIDAQLPQIGKLEAADGGTLFLDEVGAMSGAMQARVLRALEEGAVERLGGERSVPVDVRLVAAGRLPLERDVTSGRFRRDLYYRLAVIVLTLPPLRERGDDVRMLAEHFVGSFAFANDRHDLGIARDTLSLLEANPWPGNVRQLKETLELATSAAMGPLLLPADLPAETRDYALPFARQIEDARLLPLEDFERQQIQSALSMTGGHLGHARQLLGVSELALRRKLRQYGLVRWEHLAARSTRSMH